MIQINKYRHLDPEQIAASAEALSNGVYHDLQEETRLHLKECHICAEEVVNVADILSETESIKTPINYIRKENRQRYGNVLPMRKSLYITIPAAAAVLVAVFILNSQWFANLNKQEHSEVQDEIQDEKLHTPVLAQTEEVETKQDIIKKAEEVEESQEIDDIPLDTQLIAKFEPNPNLEQLYRNIQGSYRGQTIEVTAPSEIVYYEGVKLQWKNPDKQTLYLEIFNNEGEEIHLETTQQEVVNLPLLEPGLYYWKLISEEFDLLFVGKIISK